MIKKEPVIYKYENKAGEKGLLSKGRFFLWYGISVTHSAGEFPAGCCQNAGNPNGRWY